MSKVHFWVIWEASKFGLKKGTGVAPPPAPYGQCPLFLPFFLNESVPYGFDSLGEVVIQVCYRRRHLPRCPNQTVLLWFWFLGRCHNTSVLSQKTSPKGSKSDFFLWFWFLGRSRNTSVLSQITWEMLIWFGFDYLGDVEMVWFDTWETLRWFDLILGRCWDGMVMILGRRWDGLIWYLGDVEMVWFDTWEMLRWFDLILGRCWDGMVMILGRCWDGLVLNTWEM